MTRQLTPATTLDNLKKEAKRWLKALRTNDPEARARLLRAWPKGAASPVLRDVQHALAREYGFAGWKELRDALASRHASSLPGDHWIARFLEYACPDHHVRTRPAHRMASHAARRLLEQHPEIARADLYTAAVCGEVTEVMRRLDADPSLATARRARGEHDRSGAGSAYDFLATEGGKDWTALLFICFTRLPLASANDHAVEIARLLLDRGADPNAYFLAGGSRYTPLTGAIGEGEEDRPPHPRRDELARLLLDRGAEPYDTQVIYNIHFHGRVLWWLKLMHEYSVKAGRAADWADPEWRMLAMGGYGSGARWHLRIAIEHDDRELAEWCLTHGANPNAAPEADLRFPQMSLYERAVRSGRTEIAELLAGYGAERVEVVLDDEERFTGACLRLDRVAAAEILARHPEFLRSPKAIFAAARRDRGDAVALLLDMGTPVDVEDGKEQRTLHVAAAANALRAAEVLIARGAEIDHSEQNYGGTPLGFAVHYDHREMIELLARHSRDVWNLTQVGRVERLREVLRADPNSATVSGETTPLFWLPDDDEQAAAMAAAFLEHGADAGFRRRTDGETAADIARRRGLVRAAEMLEAATSGAASDGESPGQARYRQAAADFVAAYEGDTAALERLNAHYGRQFTQDDLRAEIWRRVYAFRQRSSRLPKNYLALEEAQTVVAQDAGHGSWEALLSGAAPLPPFRIDAKENRIGPLRRLNDREWDELADAVRERGITAVDAGGLMTDHALARIVRLDHVTALDLSGSRELSDDGLLQLARMTQLEHLRLNEYPGGKLTDRGLEVLRRLPNLRTFEMTWQAGISDAGAANLRFCEQLERVDLMGSPTGDGAVEALRGKARLQSLKTGRLLTDAGLAWLRDFPTLSTLLIDGPFTDDGLAPIAELESVLDLDLFWHVDGITPAGFAHLARMPNLQSLGCDGRLSSDQAMAHIGTMPRLRKLRAQESAATADGFVALSRSRTLEGFWGRECAGFGSRAFLAFAKMPALQRLGVGLGNVGESALAALPHFPALRELTPIGLLDDGFRHVGACQGLDRLTCMYCRETTDLATEHIAGLSLTYYYAGLTQITDRSLEILGRMQSLEHVDLYECKGITDAGLAFLARLPRLREVSLDGLPRVTLEGTKIFAKAVRVNYSS